MDLRPLALALALAAPAANAACESWMATGSTNWIRECNGGVDPYPQTPDHGTRQDVYVRDNGQIEVFRHQATSPGDNLRVYDYESSMRVDQGVTPAIPAGNPLSYDPNLIYGR